jgi:hypothetical protein
LEAWRQLSKKGLGLAASIGDIVEDVSGTTSYRIEILAKVGLNMG